MRKTVTRPLLMALLGTIGLFPALGAEIEPVVIYRKDVRLVTVYAWERWGNFINALPGDGTEIPYDAAKLRARVYEFPSGQVRVIDFDKRIRTHSHVNMTDTILYTWTGRRVQFANDQAAVTVPGDASFHPKGVFHHGEAIEGGQGIEFAMNVDHTHLDPQTTWISGESRPFETATARLVNGKVEEQMGSAVTPSSNAARFEVRTFDFPPYYVARELRIPRETTLPMLNDKDRLMFVLDGKATVTTEGQTWEIAQGDAARAPAKQLVNFKALTDTRILEAYVPPRKVQKPVAPGAKKD